MGARGLVYRCKLCAKDLEKSYAANHWAKKHCTIATAPYACKPCNQLFGTRRDVTNHQQKKHKDQPAEKLEDDVRDNHIEDVMDHFDCLSAAESSRVWGQKKRTSPEQSKPEQENQNLVELFREKLESGEIDTLQASLLLSGIQPPVANASNTTPVTSASSTVVISSTTTSSTDTSTTPAHLEAIMPDGSIIPVTVESTVPSAAPPVEEETTKPADPEATHTRSPEDVEDKSPVADQKLAESSKPDIPSHTSDPERKESLPEYQAAPDDQGSDHHTERQTVDKPGSQHGEEPNEESTSKKKISLEEYKKRKPGQALNRIPLMGLDNDTDMINEPENCKPENKPTNQYPHQATKSTKKRKIGPRITSYRTLAKRLRTEQKENLEDSASCVPPECDMYFEQHFQPDYDETMPEKPLPSTDVFPVLQKMDKMVHHLCQSIQNINPHLLISSINNMSKQYQATNTNIVGLSGKFESFAHHHHSSSTSSNHFLNDLKRELTSMNQNICKQYTTTNSLDRTLKEFTTTFKTFSATMTTVMTDYTAQMTNFSSLISNHVQHAFSNQHKPTQPTGDQRSASITQPPRSIAQPTHTITRPMHNEPQSSRANPQQDSLPRIPRHPQQGKNRNQNRASSYHYYQRRHRPY